MQELFVVYLLKSKHNNVNYYLVYNKLVLTVLNSFIGIIQDALLFSLALFELLPEITQYIILTHV